VLPLVTQRENLPVNLTKNNIQRSDYRDNIRHQVTKAKISQCLKIDQRRWSYTHAPRLCGAIGHEVATDLAFRSFD
jgi:hypothetical protein